jgi:hypothetical protein
LVRQDGSFAKIGEVLERKGEGDGLGELNVDIHIGLLHVGVAAKSDGTVTNVTIGGELDTVLVRFNAD